MPPPSTPRWVPGWPRLRAADQGRDHGRGRRALAVDGGQAVRGTRHASSDGQPVHLLAVIDQQAGAVLRQAEVDGKTNEITQFAPLLAGPNLAQCVITADALHTQRNHAGYLVTDRKADYILVVKGNQPGLHAQAAETAVEDHPGRRKRPAQILAHLARAPLLPLARRSARQSHPRPADPRSRRMKTSPGLSALLSVAVQEVAESAAGGNQRGGHEVDGHPGDAGEVARLVFDVAPEMARAGKNGTQAAADNSAAVVTAVSWSFACWPGRHSSQSARSWDPVTVPHPVALWNRACGGQAGLDTWVVLRSARPVPMIVPIAAPLRIRRLGFPS